MACSKKTLAFLAAVALMALVAAAVPADRGSVAVEAAKICSKSKNCNPDSCGAKCFYGVGLCEDHGGVPSCCCILKPSASVAGAGNQLPH